jgi:hypothetical protein
MKLRMHENSLFAFFFALPTGVIAAVAGCLYFCARLIMGLIMGTDPIFLIYAKSGGT